MSAAVLPQAPARRVPPRVVLAAIVLIGLALRAGPWLLSHRFLGVQEYDDGVYYASGRLLLRGLVPYRDFVIVHPPGIALAMMPFAALGDLTSDPVGLAAARVAVLAVAGVNVLLVHRITRALVPQRPWAPVVAAAVYALCPVVVTSERTVLLEPFVTTLCLLAVALLLRPRPSWASYAGSGLLVGAAIGTKLFAGTYLLSAVLVLLRARRVREPVLVVTGATLSLAVICLPFAVLAPTAFLHDVVLTQLQRPLSGLGGTARLASMLGVARAPHVVAFVVLVGLLVLCARRLRRRTGPHREVVAVLVGTVVLTMAAFLSANTYYPHYGAFLMAPVAVLLGLLWADVRRPGKGSLAALAGGALLVVYAATSTYDALQLGARPDLGGVRAKVGSACVFAETVSLAVAADLLRTSTPRCPSWIDGRGVVYTQSARYAGRKGFYDRGFTDNVAWQSELRGQLEHARYLLLDSSPEDVGEWSVATRGYVSTHFRLDERLAARGTANELWVRTTS